MSGPETLGTEEIDVDLRSLAIEPQRQLLQLDKMFDRATRWRPPAGSTSSADASAPAPPSQTRLRPSEVYPLPLGVENPNSTSPLAPLFDHPELLPDILSWFERPGEMAILAQVSRYFRDLVYKRLYGHIWIRPWEQHCNTKLILLFRTLHDRPDLGRLVKSLDVRFFPLAMIDTERYDLDDRIHSALRHMTNLQSLVWTRDKSLKPEMVQTISTMAHLRTLEISGHSHRYYDPALLADLQSLDDLRIMMPDALVRQKLPALLEALSQRQRGGLRGLGIIARNSPLVDDAMLKDVAEYLSHLRRLTLWGCTRVSREGVYAVLNEATGLQELSIDALPHSNLTDLSSSPPLQNLKTLSLSFTSPQSLVPCHPIFPSTSLPLLPPLPALTSLFLNLSRDKYLLPGDALHVLSQSINLRGLRRLGILNLVCDTAHVRGILAMGGEVEELYISIRSVDVLREAFGSSPQDRMASASGQPRASEGGELPRAIATKLRILHVNAPQQSAPSPDDLAYVAECLPALDQVGSGTRIYEVSRRLGVDGLTREVWLNRWGRVETPGYFQIWRG